jgi:predicted nucleic acid-binding protein
MMARPALKHAVLDASAIVDLLVDPVPTSLLATLLDDPEVELHVPMLCDVEVAAALRRTLRRGQADLTVATEKLGRYLDLDLSRYEHEPILERALQLHENFTLHDAVYVALAEVLGVSLLTADIGLARAARTHTTVDVIEATSWGPTA